MEQIGENFLNNNKHKDEIVKYKNWEKYVTKIDDIEEFIRERKECCEEQECMLHYLIENGVVVQIYSDDSLTYFYFDFIDAESDRIKNLVGDFN